MSNHTKCNWCNKNCYNGHFESPDYRINFCSRKCQSEYYNNFGVPPEKKQNLGWLSVLGILVVVIIIAIANNKPNNNGNTNYNYSTTPVDSIVTPIDRASAPSISGEGEFVHVPKYSCRQCGKQIDWYGSYYWESYLDPNGNVNNAIHFIEDYSLDGDDRINTELYSDEGVFTRGIFCSEDCANININNWSYPEDYKQEILNNQ